MLSRVIKMVVKIELVSKRMTRKCCFCHKLPVESRLYINTSVLIGNAIVFCDVDCFSKYIRVVG